MSASTLDRLRTITHDAGAAAGHGLTDVSSAAIDALNRIDADRIAGVPRALVDGTRASSTLARTLRPRRIAIGVGAILAAVFVAVLVVRSRRGEDPSCEADLDTRRDVRMAG